MTTEVMIRAFKDLPFFQGSAGRPGSLDARICSIETGAPGYAMDFSWTRFNEGYGTPRHRHSFDQIRYVLEGEFGLEKGLNLYEGSCGYFPEGVHYGPQLQEKSCVVLVLQFPGPGGDEFVTADRMIAARAELEKCGVFGNGVFSWTDAEGATHNMDSHRACWERATGREPAIPKGRFRSAVVVDGKAQQWVAHPDLPGVQEKHFGTFAEYRTGMGLQKFEPGAVIPAHVQEEAELRCLIGGSVTYGAQNHVGGIGDEEAMFFYFPPGAEVEDMRSEAGARFFVISLPFVSAFMRKGNDGRVGQPSLLAA